LFLIHLQVYELILFNDFESNLIFSSIHSDWFTSQSKLFVSVEFSFSWKFILQNLLKSYLAEFSGNNESYFCPKGGRNWLGNLSFTSKCKNSTSPELTHRWKSNPGQVFQCFAKKFIYSYDFIWFWDTQFEKGSFDVLYAKSTVRWTILCRNALFGF
jgi:hypothetical protein